jgi:hypothetical protein
MNVRLEFSTGFLAGVYWQGSTLMNQYHLQCEMITATRDNNEQNVALDRMKYILYQKMSHSIFIDFREKTQIKKLQAAGIGTVILPELPVDQIIGMMLYTKLNAVMEERIHLIQLRLSSDIGDNIVYLQHEQESLEPFVDRGWWNSPEPNCSESDHRQGKVVSISGQDSWQNLDLLWNKDETTDGTHNTIVAFRKDDQN